jgi:hypothetical protein
MFRKLIFAVLMLSAALAWSQPQADRSSTSGEADAAVSSAHPPSWSIAINTSPTTFFCGGRAISIPAAKSCDAALVVAREVFTAARECLGACPGGLLDSVGARCKMETFKQRNGAPARRFRVSLSWKCRRVMFDTVRPRRDCDEAAEVKDGTPVIPSGATEVEQAADVDEDLGLLSSLYPGQDTSTDAFYPLPCEPSIGGTLPQDVSLTQDELDAEATLEAFEGGKGRQIAQKLRIHPMTAISQIQPVPSAECVILKPERKVVPCSSPLLLMKDQPFEGRDIIYVHGLALTHLQDRLQNPPPSSHPANKNWPVNTSEYLDAGGYYRSYAEEYWHDHIQENLFDPNQPLNPVAGWEWPAGSGSPAYRPKANRYMIVAWSSNQTLEYAQHALLTQIYLAITSNKNVVTPPTYPSSSVFRPFCANGCILISHSTGALVVDSAMGLAKAGHFGPGGSQLAAHMAAHVSLEGAISGSRLASVGMAVGLAAVPVASGSNILCAISDMLFGTSNSCNADTSFVASSILRDLIPVVSQVVWGPAVDSTPVPTVTVAGGHPLGNFAGITKPFLPGLDDGVVSMNSACGNPNLVLPGLLAPSGVAVLNPVRAFDFSTDSGRLARAAKNWLSHKNLKAIPPLPQYLAGACTPYVSPTGMVMPALAAFRNTPWDARKRYLNHYSFIQGSIDHSYDPGDSSNRWPSTLGQGAGVVRAYKHAFTTNTEESSAVTDPAIYGFIDGNGTHLVHPSFARIHEVVRGRRIRFKLFGSKRTIWIWKRTYHLLDKWEVKQSSHYVYEFVARR